MNIYNSIIDLIGKTPLLRLSGISKYYSLDESLIGKVESFNPAGSVKDRIAKAMILDGFKKGLINKDTVIIEPTSGNTGIGLASVTASLGLKLVIVMPDSMNIERRQLLHAYGAQIVLTQGSLGMKASIKKAEELKNSYKNAFIPMQFKNESNPDIHYTTTAKEIFDDTNGEIDAIVAGVGTGGTLSGIAKYFKDLNKDVKIIAVEPLRSAFLHGMKSQPHGIQGIGASFLPKTLDMSLIDEIIDVDDADAYKSTSLIAKLDGLLVGISSGAAVYAASLIAKREEYKGKKIVVILPDTGERYLSTPAFLA